MGREDQIINERLKKLNELRKAGINPYPNGFNVKNNSKEIQDKYSKLKNEEKTQDLVSLAGRVMSIRDMGKIAFFVLQDGSGKIQLVIQEGETHDKIIDFAKKHVDSGDFIGVEGFVFRTKRGELSVLVKTLTLLTKSVLPLPEKFHGLQDDEERLRKRYLDIIMNPDVKEMFVRKAKFWRTIRNFMIDKGFIEVETPVLENSAGGASATPFATHHNALDLDVYLRISMGELWQKKLMVAGYSKTFEIGRQFRNEGMDAEHLQDYTQMEFYWAYANYKQGMELIEELYKKAAKEVFGTTSFERSGLKFDLSKKWEIIDYATEVKKRTGIDIWKASKGEIEKKLIELKQEFEPGLDKPRLIDILWKYCRRQIAGPAFLTGQPVEVAPLAKRNPEDPRKVEQFQVILAGSEVGNGYSELNDPFDQEERFKEQQKMKESGDSEAQPHDFEFVEALKYGMPPTCGFGVSERLFAFLEGKPIRETVIFPLMRPEGHKVSKEGKSKDSKIAVAVINKSAKMEAWEYLNTVSHLNASFAARLGRQLISQEKIKTKDNHSINLNIQHAIMLKESDTNAEVQELVKKAKDLGLVVSEFTREMLITTSDKQIIEFTGDKNLDDIEYLGALVFGKKSIVDTLTGKFKLFESLESKKPKKEVSKKSK